MTQLRALGAHRELSVIAPCFNEADNLKELVARTLRVFDAKGIDGELVLIDDASTDSTAELIRSFEREHPGRVRGIFHERNRGIEGGWRLAPRPSIARRAGAAAESLVQCAGPFPEGCA